MSIKKYLDKKKNPRGMISILVGEDQINELAAQRDDPATTHANGWPE